MEGVYDTNKKFHKLDFYKMQGLFEEMTKAACNASPEMKDKFEKEYKSKITRFSCELEFCLHELGWMIYNPFCEKVDENQTIDPSNLKGNVLFSNGKRTYISSVGYVMKSDFDRKSIDVEETGFPKLTDEYVGYDSDLKNYEAMDGGIIDEQGYVSSFFLPSMEDLATLELLHKMVGDKETYEDYMMHKDEYANNLDYLTSKKNVIAIKKLNDGSCTLEYVSENDGKVQKFIDELKEENRIAEFVPLVVEENHLKVA